MILKHEYKSRPLKALFLFMILVALVLPVSHVFGAEKTDRCTKEVLRAVVSSSGASLSELLKNITGEKERTELIRKFVKPIRFFPDKSGYIYVYTLDGVVVGHGGMPDLEGKDLINHRDAKGFYDVRMAIDTAIKGGGFFEHYWEKPAVKGEFKKCTYVEIVPGTKYFIGAGAYVP